ncbi:hypothetical protein ABZ864_44725 [Streptomyces sp. NPDC047082]|uniref:hypothetical protein n=1 Tax=Streptomyces sp. NPDC047082 TaxID=3155259 RepID=UPI0033ECB6FC
MLHRARPRAAVCRAGPAARHDRGREDLGARLVDHPAGGRLLDGPVLLGALQEAQDARTATAQDRYRAAVRTFETRWRVTAVGTPARDA